MSFLSLANPTSNRLGPWAMLHRALLTSRMSSKPIRVVSRRRHTISTRDTGTADLRCSDQTLGWSPQMAVIASTIQVLRIVLIIPRDSSISYLQQLTIVDLHHSNLPSHHFDHPNLGGLELAQKRLQDVTTDLDNFDKRMDDLLHIATNFNYPEDGRNNKKHAGNKGWMVDGKCSDIMMPPVT